MKLSLEQKVDQLISDVGDIKICLRGYNGKLGLIDDYEETKRDHYRFKVRVLIILATILATSGIGLGLLR